jgi:hypothetical protein
MCLDRSTKGQWASSPQPRTEFGWNCTDLLDAPNSIAQNQRTICVQEACNPRCRADVILSNLWKKHFILAGFIEADAFGKAKPASKQVQISGTELLASLKAKRNHPSVSSASVTILTQRLSACRNARHKRSRSHVRAGLRQGAESNTPILKTSPIVMLLSSRPHDVAELSARHPHVHYTPTAAPLAVAPDCVSSLLGNGGRNRSTSEYGFP